MTLSTPRRTKIIATLGPATDKPGMLEKILAAGVDLVRLNFSHGAAADHQRRVHAVRDIANTLGREIGVIADLQGPKIRIAKFAAQKITLTTGAPFTLDSAYSKTEGTETIVGIDYTDLPRDVRSDDILLLDDGRLSLKVTDVKGTQIHTEVIVGGELSNNKGINRQGGGLSAAALTDKDKADLITAVELGADYIAISFVRSADDMHLARELIQAAGGKASVIAKMERTEAIADMDSIITASDAVMVARGDLGVEIGDAELPSVQKAMIQKCRALDKAVITATQMMETMITNAIPTRAEVFDVANAVLDGTDAVMLSAETASGNHPDKVVMAMANICLGAEKNRDTQVSKHRVECTFKQVDEAIAMATMYLANHFAIKAIIALTESGLTPLLMSRIRSGIPIYAISRHVSTCRKMSLYRGVYPIHFDILQVVSAEDIPQTAAHILKEKNFVAKDDHVILTRGELLGVRGTTDSMRIIKVDGDHPSAY